jgi:transposase-like protein
MNTVEDSWRPRDLVHARRYFGDSRASVRLVANVRWPKGVTCPRCGSTRVRFISTRCLWECAANHEKKQFSVRVGTIFEGSAVGLDKWLAAIWMLANGRTRVSSRQLQRIVGVTQKSAWFMLRRLSLAMEGGEAELLQAGRARGALGPCAGTAKRE